VKSAPHGPRAASKANLSLSGLEEAEGRLPTNKRTGLSESSFSIRLGKEEQERLMLTMPEMLVREPQRYVAVRLPVMIPFSEEVDPAFDELFDAFTRTGVTPDGV
jgi:hypothetical protein